MDRITSVKNSNIVRLKALKTQKGRDAYDQYIAEGSVMVRDIPALNIKEIYVREDDALKYKDIIENTNAQVYMLTANVFQSVASQDTPSGILTVLERQVPAEIPKERLVLVLDTIRDPGNMGTIIRSAVAMDVYDFILLECVDPYNPKTVRASMGSLVYANLVIAAPEDLEQLLSGRMVVALDASGDSLCQFKPQTSMALILGGEITGLSSKSRAIADKIVSIPMPSKKIESLNAGVSASIALFYITNHTALVNHK